MNYGQMTNEQLLNTLRERDKKIFQLEEDLKQKEYVILKLRYQINLQEERMEAIQEKSKSVSIQSARNVSDFSSPKSAMGVQEVEEERERADEDSVLRASLTMPPNKPRARAKTSKTMRVKKNGKNLAQKTIGRNSRSRLEEAKNLLSIPVEREKERREEEEREKEREKSPFLLSPLEGKARKLSDGEASEKKKSMRKKKNNGSMSDRRHYTVRKKVEKSLFEGEVKNKRRSARKKSAERKSDVKKEENSKKEENEKEERKEEKRAVRKKSKEKKEEEKEEKNEKKEAKEKNEKREVNNEAKEEEKEEEKEESEESSKEENKTNNFLEEMMEGKKKGGNNEEEGKEEGKVKAKEDDPLKGKEGKQDMLDDSSPKEVSKEEKKETGALIVSVSICF